MTLGFAFLILIDLAFSKDGFARGAFRKLPPTLRGDDLVQYWMDQLSLREKCDLLRGSVDTHGYTGFVPGNARLGIPSMRMNDGPQGFRGPKKTSTAWPCGLAMATTFWPELVHKVAQANGFEFIQKGANVFLGPGMNMARIPKNGRTFEYLTGEDPFLGEVMAETYVAGIQSNAGLIATAKHFVNNEQEADRTKVDAIIDDETQWNMYYRPFRAAVKAGCQSIMCSYNRINGMQGCASETTIKRDLEERMGFDGFVMSDWFAVTGTVETAMAGMDVEMPIPLYYGDALLNAIKSGRIPEAVLNEKIRRVLSTMVRSNFSLEEKFNPAVNVTSAEHSRLARVAAANSVLLLKNQDEILPLNPEAPGKIVVVGDRGKDRVLSTGGGSGHVHPAYVVSPLEGLTHGGLTNGITYLNTAHGMAAAEHVYTTADKIIIVVGVSATEGLDRASLSFDNNELELINRISSLNPNVIVCITSPGTVLLPFLDSVKAVVLQFMPGQEAGNALADVLYGVVDPGGARLPLTIPNRDNEMQMSPRQYPGINFETAYSERTRIGYRWYTTSGVKPHLPFGFGTSYASFKFIGVTYRIEENGDLTFNIGLMNNSKRKGVMVPQVYVTSFPDAAAKIVAPIALVGFQRAELQPMEVQTVVVTVKQQALAVWTKVKQDYVVFPGKYQFSVGPSSADFWKTVEADL